MEEAKKQQGRVLIVDDEKELLETLKMFLEPHFTEIALAYNAEDALKIQQEKKADVIISDLKMPGMSGLEFLETLRKAHDDTPFIVITGFASIESTITALRYGAFDFFNKPFIAKDIVEKTIEAFETSLMLKSAEFEVIQKIERGDLPENISFQQKTAAKYILFMKKAREHYKPSDL